MLNPPAYHTVAFAIGDRVKQARYRLQLTQRELARRLSVSQSYLSEVEGNKAKPNVDLLVGFAIYFPELNAEWILTGVEPMMRAENLLYEWRDNLDHHALVVSQYLLEKWIEETEIEVDLHRAAYSVALIYRTYMANFRALMASGTEENEARSKALLECKLLDKREIENTPIVDRSRNDGSEGPN